MSGGDQAARERGSETRLDRAVRMTEGEAEASGAVFDALFGAELSLMLDAETDGDAIRPTLLELEAGPTALAFDRPGRLAAFAGRAAPCATMSGRSLVSLIAGWRSEGRALSLAVNPGVAPSELFYGPETLAWAAGFLNERPAAAEAAGGLACARPAGASRTLLAALDAKLAALAPLVAEAWLVRAERRGGAGGLLLVLRLRDPRAEPAAAQALAETAGLAADEAAPDLAFASEGEPLLEQARKVGLGFEPPAPGRAPAKPDPDRPPRLR